MTYEQFHGSFHNQMWFHRLISNYGFWKPDYETESGLLQSNMTLTMLIDLFVLRMAYNRISQVIINIYIHVYICPSFD